MSQKTNNDKQVKPEGGEGDTSADRHYREKTKDFVKSGKVEEAARKAKEQDPEEARKAEEKGREKAKELDPEVHREFDKPTKDSK